MPWQPDIEYDNIQAVNGHVIVDIMPRDYKVHGLTLVSRKHEDSEETLKAKVVSCAEDVREVKEGDIVLIRGYAGRYAGTKPGDGSVTRRAITPDEIICLIEPAESEVAHA